MLAEKLGGSVSAVVTWAQAVAARRRTDRQLRCRLTRNRAVGYRWARSDPVPRGEPM